MKTQTFCEKIFALLSVEHADYLMSHFNDLLDEQRAQEHSVVSLYRTLRQTEIRLSLAINTYEVSGKHAEMVVQLLKTEEELLLEILHGNDAQPALPTVGGNLRWTGTVSDLTELIYGLHTVGSINEGKCDISEIVQAFERLFHIRLPQVYNTFLAIRNRKKERTVFLKKLYEMMGQKLSDMDR